MLPENKEMEKKKQNQQQNILKGHSRRQLEIAPNGQS